MTVIRIEWVSPTGRIVNFGVEPPYLLREVDGLSDTLSEPVSQRAPGQRGSTLQSLKTESRVVSLVSEIDVESYPDLWDRREDLAAAFVAVEDLDGQPKMGVLRVYRQDRPALELDAVPRMTLHTRINPYTPHGEADLEWFCPNPYWRSIADLTVHMGAQSGGLSYPKSYPKSYDSQNVTVDIAYGGSVPAPPVFRVYGELTTPRMRNVTTGEVIEVTGLIPDGEFIEIQTAFGQKSIEHVTAAGVRTSIMHRLNLNRADFWHLQPGLNTVTFEADSNVSGEAYVTWREWFGGI